MAQLTFKVSLLIRQEIIIASSNVDVHTREPDLQQLRLVIPELLVHLTVNNGRPSVLQLFRVGARVLVSLLPLSPELLEVLGWLCWALIIGWIVPERRGEWSSVLVKS